MASAAEGFQWLREFEYSVQWFSEYNSQLRELLGAIYVDNDARDATAEALRACQEHAEELKTALNKLLDIVEGRL